MGFSVYVGHATNINLEKFEIYIFEFLIPVIVEKEKREKVVLDKIE